MFDIRLLGNFDDDVRANLVEGRFAVAIDERELTRSDAGKTCALGSGSSARMLADRRRVGDGAITATGRAAGE